MLNFIFILISSIFILWLMGYAIYIRIRYFEMLSFTMQQTIDKLILQEALSKKNDNSGEILNYINKIDRTMTHIKDFGDVIYSPYREQLDILITCYEDLKNNLKY